MLPISNRQLSLAFSFTSKYQPFHQLCQPPSPQLLLANVIVASYSHFPLQPHSTQCKPIDLAVIRCNILAQHPACITTVGIAGNCHCPSNLTVSPQTNATFSDLPTTVDSLPNLNSWHNNPLGHPYWYQCEVLRMNWLMYVLSLILG